MRISCAFAALISMPLCGVALAQESLEDRALRYLIELVRLDTTNPPGNETRAAEYLKREADKEGIPNELVGPDPARLSFIARLKGSGAKKPLLLMAHTDVVPVDRAAWTVDPYSATIKEGFVYGRGTQDVKSLLAAEFAVLVELKRSGAKLDRDIILLAESDEEAGSTGMTWIVKNAYEKIDAEFALNEFGYWQDASSGERVFQIQTSEKVPTRIRLRARGTAGHGSLPRADNPVAHLAKAIAKLADAGQPVELNTTTRTYFREMAKIPANKWLIPYLPKLENTRLSGDAAREIHERNAEFDAMLHTTVSPTMLEAGVKINVIPNQAVAQIDVRRLPTETREQIHERFRKIIGDPAIEVENGGGQEMPATEPSSLTSPLYLAMKTQLQASHPKSVVIPFMMRGATDGSFLREKGIAVYGTPIFDTEGEPRWHGNDERISVGNMKNGTGLLMKIVRAVAAN